MLNNIKTFKKGGDILTNTNTSVIQMCDKQKNHECYANYENTMKSQKFSVKQNDGLYVATLTQGNNDITTGDISTLQFKDIFMPYTKQAKNFSDIFSSYWYQKNIFMLESHHHRDARTQTPLNSQSLYNALNYSEIYKTFLFTDEFDKKK